MSGCSGTGVFEGLVMALVAIIIIFALIALVAWIITAFWNWFNKYIGAPHIAFKYMFWIVLLTVIITALLGKAFDWIGKAFRMNQISSAMPQHGTAYASW